MVPAIAVCWLAAGLLAPAPDATNGNPLALHRSVYGSQIARLMKNSLHMYWHDGREEKEGEHHDEASPEAPPPPGRLKLLRRPSPPPVVAAPAPVSKSWLERATESLSHLQDQQTERNSPFATSQAHRRYLTAAADWRLYQGYQFDPCDAALYEIAHFTALARAPTLEAKRQAATHLARQTIAHALAPTSGLAEALTGAAAAINLFNDQLQPDRDTPPNPATLQSLHIVLDQCLSRYKTLRQQADAEGWWQQIPEIRRSEIEAYATMLERLAGMIENKKS